MSVLGTHFDVICLGLGGVGSSVCSHLAARGARTLGLERFSPVHSFGSSHGRTRIFREAYFEGPKYIPLLKESRRLWQDLEASVSRSLYEPCGLLTLAPSASRAGLQKAESNALEHEIPLEALHRDELRRRFPEFEVPEDFSAIFEPGAGYLRVEAAVRAQLDLATRAGATLHFQERVHSWKADSGRVEVTTDAGNYSADRLVIAGGVWAGELLENLRLPIEVRRTVQLWFPHVPTLKQIPCFAFDLPGLFVYGFPSIEGQGLKAANHHAQGPRLKDPLEASQELEPGDFADVVRIVRPHLKGFVPKVSSHAVCRYGMTPDEDFLVGIHPEHPEVSFAAGLSGHGFKFVPILGSILADLALQGTTQHDIGFLGLSRFS